MRLSAMYTGPVRIRRRSPNNPEPDYGETLSPEWFQNQNYFTARWSNRPHRGGFIRHYCLQASVW
jgi:hypothetical protein